VRRGGALCTGDIRLDRPQLKSLQYHSRGERTSAASCHHSGTTGNAIQCNTLQPVAEKTGQKCGICKALQPPSTPDRSLVLEQGKAVRVRSSALFVCLGTRNR
jgi:hypothetical protein